LRAYTLRAAPEARAKAVSEIKALCSDPTLASNNAAWVQAFVKPCCDALAAIPVALDDPGVAKLRGLLLEVLMRTPQGDAAKASAPDTFAALLTVAQRDTAENASSATKYMFELLKNYKGAMEAQAQQFLEFGQQVCMQPGMLLNVQNSAFMTTSFGLLCAVYSSSTTCQT
jgi:hypothetical protein